MTRRMPLYVVAVAAICFLMGVAPGWVQQPPSVTAFGRLPVLSEGRFKPLDSLARSTLLVIQGHQDVTTPDKRDLTSDEWLLDVFFAPDKADTYPIFYIDNPDLLSLVGKNEVNLTIERLSFN